MQKNPYSKLSISNKINWNVVELEVIKTKKLVVTVPTIGWIPKSNSIGPKTTPPPIPIVPAINPATNPIKHNLIIVSLVQFISFESYGKLMSFL